MSNDTKGLEEAVEQVISTFAIFNDASVSCDHTPIPREHSGKHVCLDEIMVLVKTHIDRLLLEARKDELNQFREAAESWVEKHHSYLGVNYLNQRLATLNKTEDKDE